MRHCSENEEGLRMEKNAWATKSGTIINSPGRTLAIPTRADRIWAPHVPVLAYRLLQYTLRDVMIAELGVEKADELFIRAGRLAGVKFCRNLLDAAEDRGEVHPFNLPGVSGHSVPRIAGKMT